jgi:hypothetical protein
MKTAGYRGSIEQLGLWLSLIAVVIGQLVFIYPELQAIDGVINGDGRGYYDYLTSVFIDHDLADQPINGRYLLEYNGTGVNKYFIGTAILMLPFFLLGLLVAAVFGFPLDGLSWPFQWSMTLSALFYWGVGLYFLMRLLRARGISSAWIAVSLIVLTIGTNAFYYLTVDPTASHVYSFAAIAALLWYGNRWLSNNSYSSIVLAGLALGLVVAIRPVNALVVLLIIGLAHDRTMLKASLSKLMTKPVRMIALAGSLAAFPLLQLIAYKIQTGDWIVWSYANEGFYFTQPEAWKFLFSFERGWLVYSPAFLLIIPALIGLFKTHRWTAEWWSVWLIITVYLLSAWWSWHYGGSYGSRPMIDFYAGITLVVMLWLNTLHWRKWYGWALSVFLICTTLLSVSQVYQLKHGIISPWHMNAGKYFWSLGKLSEQDMHRLGGRWDTPPYHKQTAIWYVGAADPNENPPHWHFTKTDGSTVKFNANTPFNGTFRYTIRQEQSAFLGVMLQLESKEEQQDAASEAYVVIEAKHPEGERFHYDAFYINDFPGNDLDRWQTWSYRYIIPSPVQTGDEVTVYFWNKGLGSFSLRNVQLELKAYLTSD